jgi:predicted MFS family arabinose efflux permease
MSAVTSNSAAGVDTSGSSTRLLAGLYAIVVANLYYFQPLMPRMAHELHRERLVAFLVTVSHAGFVVALVLIVPLGDLLHRRPLILALLALQCASLFGISLADNADVVLGLSALLGLATAGVIHTLVPYAAQIAPTRERGRAIAIVVTGGLVGVTLSRPLAGAAGAAFGWRSVFAMAAAIDLVLIAVVRWRLPSIPRQASIRYREQLAATFGLLVSEPQIRRRSLIGACLFAAFAAFWSTAPYLLANHYKLGSAAIGLVGLVGAAGALAGRLFGPLADRGGTTRLGVLTLMSGGVSAGLLWGGGHSLLLLMTGLVLMDVAVTSTHVLNMSLVYRDRPAQARLSAVYMTCYTAGGLVGSAVASAVYRDVGWAVTPLLTLCAMAVGLLVHLRDSSLSRVEHGLVLDPATHLGERREQHEPAE